MEHINPLPLQELVRQNIILPIRLRKMEICVQMQYNSLIFTQDGLIMLKIILQKRNAIIKVVQLSGSIC